MEQNVDKKAIYKLTYGLFLLTTNDGNKDNCCVVNTVSLITETPRRITVYVNKLNYTEETIRKTGKFNVSILTESTPFDTFKEYGFQSGKDVDKMQGKSYPRSTNGLFYIPEHTNAYISAKVIDALDYGTHTLFVADVEEAKVLSDEKSVTYEYYLKEIKPKPVESAPQNTAGKKIVGWRCKICGYVYEGENLPSDFVCPWCKHSAEDFEPIYE